MTTTTNEPEPNPKRTRRNWRALLLPSGVSLAVHAALLVALLTITVAVVTRHQPVGDGTPTTITLDAVAPPRNEAANQPQPESHPEPRAALSETVARTRALADELAHEPRPAASPAPPTSEPRDIAPARPTTPTAVPAAPPAAPATFAGVRADRERAGSVVFLIDTSGPMAACLPFVTEELARSIERLHPSQRFAVLSVSAPPGEPARVRAPPGLAPRPALALATPAHKAAARDWLATLQPAGRSELAPGLLAALDLRPDAVLVLSRTIERTNDPEAAARARRELLEPLDRRNPRDARTGRRAISIAAVQFIDDDPLGLLPALGAAHANRDAPAPGERSPGYTRLTVEDLLARSGAGRALDEAQARADRASQALRELGALELAARVSPQELEAADLARARDAGAHALQVLPNLASIAAGHRLDPDRSEWLEARVRALRTRAEQIRDARPGARFVRVPALAQEDLDPAIGAFERAAEALIAASEAQLDEAAESFDHAARSLASPLAPEAEPVRAILRAHLAPRAGASARRWSVLGAWHTGEPERLAPYAGEHAPTTRVPTAALARSEALRRANQHNAAISVLIESAASRELAAEARLQLLDATLTPSRLARALDRARLLAGALDADGQSEAVRERARAHAEGLVSDEAALDVIARACARHALRVPVVESAVLRRLLAHAEGGELDQSVRLVREALSPGPARDAGAEAVRGALRERVRTWRDERDARGVWPERTLEAIDALHHATGHPNERDADTWLMTDATMRAELAWLHAASAIDRLGSGAVTTPQAEQAGRLVDEAARLARKAHDQQRIAAERARLRLALGDTSGAIAAARAGLEPASDGAIEPSTIGPSTIDPSAGDLWCVLVEALAAEGESIPRVQAVPARAAARAHADRLFRLDPAFRNSALGERLRRGLSRLDAIERAGQEPAQPG